MAFHQSNFGALAGGLRADIDGYVPEAGDGPFAGNWDHGTERTHNVDGSLTEYGQWWVEQGYPELLASNIEATAEAQESLHKFAEGRDG